MDSSQQTAPGLSVRAVARCATAKERAVATCVAAVVAGAVGLGAGVVWHLLCGPTTVGVWYNKYFIIFITMVAFCGLLFWVYRKELESRPDTLFLLLLLTITAGTSVLYDINPVSWDVGNHFKFVMEWFGLDETRLLSAAEQDTYTTAQPQITTNLADLAGWKNALNASAFQPGVDSVTMNPGNILARLPHLPAACVYFVAKLAGLSFVNCFLLGKLTYPVIYSVVCWLAMRQLRSGKMILACVAMIPTSLFLCESYGYDYWVICFTLLGVAGVVGAIQRTDEPMTLGRSVLILGSFFLACLPKFVYAPLAFLAFLIPTDRFRTKRQAWAFRVGCLGVVALLALTLFLPMLLRKAVVTQPGQVTGDARGGSGVNASAQVQYVLENFPHYVLGILAPYLLWFLAPWESYDYLTSYAYLGKAYAFAPFVLALLIWVCVTDKTEADKPAAHWWDRLVMAPLVIVVLGVSASALYVDFTPVGHDTINGFQGRYFLPCLFPILYFAGFPSVAERVRPNVRHYNAIALSVACVLVILSTWMMYVYRIV